MRTSTEFIKLPIILFTMLLLASCGNDGPIPEDTSTDVARKFLMHLLNEEYEEAGEYCLGSNYSKDGKKHGREEHFFGGVVRISCYANGKLTINKDC